MSFQACLRAPKNRSIFFPIALLALACVLTSACSSPEKKKAAFVANGEAYLKEKKFQEASIEFRNATQIDDRYAAAHWGLARSYEGLQHYAEAVDELRRTVQLDGSNLDARVKLGNFDLLAAQQKNAARDQLEKYMVDAESQAQEILARDANHIEGHILLASIYVVRSDKTKALGELNRAIEIDPKRTESHLSLARFYAQNNDLKKAEEVFRHAIAMNDNLAVSHMEYGKFFVQQNNNDAAENEFKKAVAVEPSNRDARLLLASFYLANKRMNKAEENYKALAEFDKDTSAGRSVLADFYAMNGRYDEAIAIYQEVVNKSSDNMHARYRLGELLLQRGDATGAAAQAEEALRANNRDAQALTLRARAAMQSGDTKKAIDDLKEALRQEPRSRNALYFMAQANFQAGQLEQARAFAADLERFYPNFLPASLMQAQLSFASGDAKTAQRTASDLITRAAKTTPDGDNTTQVLAEVQAKAFTLRGAADVIFNDLRAARNDFENARAIAPNDPQSYVNLATVSIAEKNLNDAAQNFERALQLDKTNYNALNGLTKIVATQGHVANANARIDAAMGVSVARGKAASAPLHFLKAQICDTQHDAPCAETELRAALDADARYLPAYFALGALYFNTNSHDRALAEYRAASEKRPDSVQAFVMMGLIEAARANYDAAVEQYKRALALDVGSPIANNNLAIIYADQGKGNLDEAVRMAQQLVQHSPNEPNFADTLGWVYYRKGLYRAAIEQLQKAVTKATSNNADSAVFRYHLGVALAAQGDKTRARAELQQAVQLADKQAFKQLDDAKRALASL